MTDIPLDFHHVIQSTWGPKLNQQRHNILELIKSGLSNMPVNQSRELGVVRAPSFSNSKLDLTLSWDVRDPSGFGTFDGPEAIYLINVELMLSTKAGVVGPPNRYDHLSNEEEESWIHAALGPEIFDYSYRVITGPMLVRNRPTKFAVFVTAASMPILAPEDFAWHIAGSGGPANRQKLRPRLRNRNLEDHLRLIGDLTPVGS